MTHFAERVQEIMDELSDEGEAVLPGAVGTSMSLHPADIAANMADTNGPANIDEGDDAGDER